VPQRWQLGGDGLAAAVAAAATPAKLPPCAAAVAGGNKDTGSNSIDGGKDKNQELTKSGGSKRKLRQCQ
jgi:hypothetical protein